jgi:hypothetical protein
MRRARTPRPARPNPRRAIPSQAVRNRRGPRPPEHLIASLRAALEATWRAAGLTADAEGAPLGLRWTRAVRRVATRLVEWVRRGVAGALRGTRTIPPSAPTPAAWVASTTAAVRAASTLSGAVAAATNAVLAEHSRQVGELSKAAGAHAYIWSTQLDSRVRPLHALLEGTRQRWDDPPLAGLPSFHGHPGEAGGCRCFPYPWVL